MHSAPKRTVRKCAARADADREVWASSGEEIPDADHREAQHQRHDLGGPLLASVTALALVLGAVGVYGVISHFAARRRRDWAIRVALGLSASRVIAHVVGHGALLVTAGIVIGSAGAALLTRVLSTFLYGVGAIDPIAVAAAAVALLGVGSIAALVPAWRAATADPLVALREQ